MEKDNRFKLRLSRMFYASFDSCRSRNISDVIEKAVFVPSHSLPPPSPPPKPRPFTSICPDPTRTVNNTCIVSARDVARRSASRVRQKVAEQHPRLSHVRFCPPSSPLSPSPFYEKTEKMKKRSTVKKKTKRKNPRRPLLSSPSQDTTTTPYDYYGGGDWFSSDDEREEEVDDEVETLFSSRSTFSSDSSPSRVTRHNHRRRRTHRSNSTSRRRTTKKDDVLPLNESKYEIKDSVAVVKRSSDPYSDFRTSMVEMIVERQIFGGAELDKLLQCFLALNSVHHHATIVEVFREIRETLFSDLYC